MYMRRNYVTVDGICKEDLPLAVSSLECFPVAAVSKDDTLCASKLTLFAMDAEVMREYAEFVVAVGEMGLSASSEGGGSSSPETRISLRAAGRQHSTCEPALFGREPRG